MWLRITILCFLLSVYIAGCAFTGRAYEGPQQPPEKVAAVYAGMLDATRRILINKVDERVFSPSLSATEVMPGPHELELWYWDMVSRFPFWTNYAYAFVAKFDAEPGRIYEFDGEGEWSARSAPISVWLTDTSTRTVVWEGTADASRPVFILR